MGQTSGDNAIVVEDAHAVRTLTLNRPDKRNALTTAMYATLADALTGAADDDTLGAVLIQGSAGCFTAGNDLGDFLSNPPLDENSPVLRFLAALATFPKPVVAAVEGVAVGVGTTMLMHCDLIYAADTARFATPFVSLGLVPEAGSSLLASRLMGHPRAAALLLLGESLDAAQAVTAGLINAVVDAATLHTLAQDKARALASLPRAAMRASKALMRADTPLVLETIKREAALFARHLRHPEARAAFEAFLAKGKK